MEKPPEPIYAPKCTSHDMEKMMDLVRSKNSLMYSHIEPKIPTFKTQSRIASAKTLQPTVGALEKEPVEHYRFSLLTEGARKNRARPPTATVGADPKHRFVMSIYTLFSSKSGNRDHSALHLHLGIAILRKI